MWTDEVGSDGRARDILVAADQWPAFNTVRRLLVHTATGQDDDAGLRRTSERTMIFADTWLP